MKKVLVLNGPNLSRLDLREESIYGSLNYSTIKKLIEAEAQSLGLSAEVRQSDDETELIHWIHEAADAGIPLIINPAAFTHYSYAIRDALEMVKSKVIEVHLSNPLAREEFRHTSVISGVATGTISGFGVDSYLLALRVIAKDS